MVLENRSYVPTLAVRPSEMKGLENLPGATKDEMTPCFLLAPWANSNSLGRTIDRIQSAYPNRSYFLDIDRDYQLSNLESGPQRELAGLLDPSSSYGNWLNFVRQYDRILPCVQSRGLTEAEILQQIREFQNLGRSYCMRIVRDRFPANVGELIGAFSAEGTADFAIILEGGWTRDPLSLAVWFNGVIAETLVDIDANVPTVLSCTSIPKLFTELSGVTRVPFTNRQLIHQVRQRSNRTRIIYGDWGSTRPREPGGYANRPLDRIDYPVDDSWYVSRNKDANWDFREAAGKIVEERGVWDGDLGIWGEDMIQQTTISSALGIDTPQKNVAARVNIHLHRQTFFGQEKPNPSAFDEDWQD